MPPLISNPLTWLIALGVEKLTKPEVLITSDGPLNGEPAIWTDVDATKVAAPVMVAPLSRVNRPEAASNCADGLMISDAPLDKCASPASVKTPLRYRMPALI